jgi:diadenosine hexaphosphate hydrolase (ATP-forming)
MKKKISCMGIVIANSIQGHPGVLILENEGEWVFPKGHVIPGEEYIETACREILEETNIAVNPDECLGKVDEFSFYFEGEQAEKVIYVFLFVIDNLAEISPNKEEGFSGGDWFSFPDALVKLTHQDAKNSLEKAIAKLNESQKFYKL